jgi:hypothetical protein
MNELAERSGNMALPINARNTVFGKGSRIDALIREVGHIIAMAVGEFPSAKNGARVSRHFFGMSVSDQVQNSPSRESTTMVITSPEMFDGLRMLSKLGIEGRAGLIFRGGCSDA